MKNKTLKSCLLSADEIALIRFLRSLPARNLLFIMTMYADGCRISSHSRDEMLRSIKPRLLESYCESVSDFSSFLQPLIREKMTLESFFE